MSDLCDGYTEVFIGREDVPTWLLNAGMFSLDIFQ